MSQICPRFGRGRHEIAPPGDIFDQPPGEMRRIRGKLADHVEGHAVLSPEGAVLMTTSGTESSNPRPPQSLNDSVPNPARGQLSRENVLIWSRETGSAVPSRGASPLILLTQAESGTYLPTASSPASRFL